MIEVVKVYAEAISAADREFVERVRVHILPTDPIEFDTLDGGSITVGGSDLVGLYFESLESHRHQRGATYIPQLVSHDGPAVGALAHYELDDAGIWAVVDLWAEGVAARKGRDFVSAFWEFGDVGDDGRPRSAIAQEVSFTPTPQFALAQSPVEPIAFEDSPRVAATISAAAYSTAQEANMTPEEMAAALLGLDEFKDALSAMVAEAIAANAPEADAEAEAEDVAAMEGEEEEVPASVAASVVKTLEALNSKIDRVAEATKVAASLRGQKSTAASAPAPGVDYINKRIEAGVSMTQALAENAALTKGA
jgi:hypothetical protein